MFVGCSTSLQAALFQSSQDEAQCFIENQADVWEAAVCPYQACEGMLVEAEKLSSMAAMDSQPGSYVSLMNISMGQEDWIGGLEAAQPASASRPAKGVVLSFAGFLHRILAGSRTDHHLG